MKPFHPYILVAMSCVLPGFPWNPFRKGSLGGRDFPYLRGLPSLAGCQSRDLARPAPIITF